MAQAISPAETLLFQTDHLQNIDAPVTLVYSYKKDASEGPSFEDEVYADVNIKPNVSVSMRFLPENRKLNIQDIDHAMRNPVLLGFLRGISLK